MKEPEDGDGRTVWRLYAEYLEANNGDPVAIARARHNSRRWSMYERWVCDSGVFPGTPEWENMDWGKLGIKPEDVLK